VPAYPRPAGEIDQRVSCRRFAGAEQAHVEKLDLAPVRFGVIFRHGHDAALHGFALDFAVEVGDAEGGGIVAVGEGHAIEMSLGQGITVAV
jgi:hypothetical protein